MTHARLIDTAAPRVPRGVVLVLHGGATRRRPMRVSPTQLLTAGEDAVVSGVALNPWVHPHEGHLDLTGGRILIVHGDDDRVARPTSSAAVARDLARTARVGYVTVDGGRHAMLRRHDVFDGLAAGFATATLLGHRPEGVLARVLAGEECVDI